VLLIVGIGWGIGWGLSGVGAPRTETAVRTVASPEATSRMTQGEPQPTRVAAEAQVRPSAKLASAPARVAPRTLTADAPANPVVAAKPDTPVAVREAESFVPLLPMTAREFGGARLARVRFRGGAASALGLGVRLPAPSTDGFVEADVLLGEDGMARAIRFVR
jgi:hypothetical protein